MGSVAIVTKDDSLMEAASRRVLMPQPPRRSPGGLIRAWDFHDSFRLGGRQQPMDVQIILDDSAIGLHIIAIH